MILVVHHTADGDDEQRDSVEKSHAGRGYEESVYGSHIAYHFLVGTDGTIVQNRALSERTGHTRNSEVNRKGIAVVFAGNFQDQSPPDVQLRAGRDLIERLDAIYHFEEIIAHRDASPTACPGEKLMQAFNDLWRGDRNWQVWNITRYYSPEPGQMRYFRPGPEGYKADVAMNCGLYSDDQLEAFRASGRTVSADGMLDDGTYGDCAHPADGKRLDPSEAFKAAACPPGVSFGTKIEIEGIGIVTCRDRGGAIKEKRLDVWAGYGTNALHLLSQYPGGYLRVRFLD